MDGQLQYIVDHPQTDATTGETGRFRLTGLQEGHYIIEVKADGFKDRELEGIPAGDEKVVVTLERSP